MTTKLSKRIIAIFLCVMMLCGNFMVTGSAADTEYTLGNYTYTVSSGKTTITAYKETATGSVEIPEKLGGYPVVKIDEYAFFGCTLIESVVVPTSVKEIGKYAFAYCTTLSSVTIPSSVTSIGEKAFNNSKNVTVMCPRGSFAESYAGSYGLFVEYIPSDNIYNLGEETYSFENFSGKYTDDHGNFHPSECYDEDCTNGGHCFGMSVTSSAYYLNLLSKKDLIGCEQSNPTYNLLPTTYVKMPICYYMKIQGYGPEQDSMVAGGSIDLHGVTNTTSDWNACVNYVKNHEYDNSGALQVGMWYKGGGGHAVNFLYYSYEGGQDRIYVYDNNFPDRETYYYMGRDGLIYQAPLATSSNGIIGMDLMDVDNYFDCAPSFSLERHIYADKDQIEVKGAKMSYMKCGSSLSSKVIFSIPAYYKEVEITPLVDNASFEYLDKKYSFGEVEEGTVGVLELAELGSDSEVTAPSFKINDGGLNSVIINDITINYKSNASLSATIDATKDYKCSFSYTSTNPNVATVDENGNVYGAGRGEATITCTVTDEAGNSVSDTCKVTVKYAWWQWIIKIVLFGWIWY